MKSLYNTIMLLVLLVFLTGCPGPHQINLIAKPVKKPELILPTADTLYLKPITWTLINKHNVDASFADLEKQGRPPVFFSVTDEGYEHLSTNASDVRAYIRQQQAIINAYKNYYIKTDRAINSANEQINAVNDQVSKVNDEVVNKQPWYKRWFTKTPNE